MDLSGPLLTGGFGARLEVSRRGPTNGGKEPQRLVQLSCSCRRGAQVAKGEPRCRANPAISLVDEVDGTTCHARVVGR